MDRAGKAYVLGLAAVLCWSTVATSFKIGLRSLTVPEFLTVAVDTSCVVLLVALLAMGRWRALVMLPARAWGRYALLGLLNPVGHYMVLLNGYDRLPASIAQPINFTWPLLFVLLGAVVFRKKIKAWQVVFMVVSFSGVAVLSLGRGAGGGVSLAGVLLMLLSTVIWSAYWIINQKDRNDSVAGLLVCFLAAAAVLNCGWVAGIYSTPSMEGALAAAYAGVFEMGLPFVLWLGAIKTAPDTSSVSQLTYLAPIISLIFIATILGERLTVSTFVGLALVLTGIYLNQRFVAGKLRKKSTENKPNT